MIGSLTLLDPRGRHRFAETTCAGISFPPREWNEPILSLVSQVTARLRSFETPVVQFIQATAVGSGNRIPGAFAEACLRLRGPVLYASLRPDLQEVHVGRSVNLNAAAPARRRRRLSSEGPEIAPDACLGGLYHVRFSDRVIDPATQLLQAPWELWLQEPKLGLRMMVIDCAPLEHCPGGLEIAARCNGSVLSVAAGITRLAALRAAARHLEGVGGTVLGSVLYDAPPEPRWTLPSWPFSLGRSFRLPAP